MTIKTRALLSLLVALVTMGMAGCGHYVCGTTFGGSGGCTPSGGGLGSTGSGGGTAFFYFIDDNGVNIGLDKEVMGATGSFTNVQLTAPPVPDPVTDGGTTVVDQKYLYIAFENNTVYGYSIDASTGGLTSLPNSPYTALGGHSITSDPAGKFVFVGDFFGQRITVFSVNSSDGSLTEVNGSPFATTGVEPLQMTTDGQGKFLYAVEGFPGSVVGAYTIDQTSGALTAVAGNPFSFPMAEISGEKTGSFLIGTTSQSGYPGGSVDKSVYVFGINSTTGVIAPVSGSPFATTYAPINIAVSPNGSWVYTFNQDVLGTLDPMEGFTINSSSGALTPLGTSPFTSLLAGVGAFEQSGQSILAIGQLPTSLTVSAYQVDTTSGAVTNPFSALGFPGLGNFAVTDAPTQ